MDYVAVSVHPEGELPNCYFQSNSFSEISIISGNSRPVDRFHFPI